MTTYISDPFFQTKTTKRKTSQGMVDLPILYFDTSNVLAFFLCDTNKVTRMLRGTHLKPGLSVGNRTVVAISFYEYRKTTVGVYNEVGVAIPVLHYTDRAPLGGITDLYSATESRKLGFHVLDLPVTTEMANAAGRELWGYPKFVTDISFQLGGGCFHSKVQDPDSGQTILSIDGRVGLGVNVPPLSPVTYSRRKDTELRTTVNVRGDVKLSYPWGMKLTVGNSQHIMAKNLRALGLENARPISLMSTDKFQSRLNEGIEI